MLKRFSDLPLSWKVLIPPALILIALLGIAGIAMKDARQQEAAVQQLDAVVFERLRTALEIKDAITLFHARLYGLMSAAVNESDKKRLESYADALPPQIARAGEQLGKFGAEASADPSAGWRGTLEAARKALKDYQSGALQ